MVSEATNRAHKGIVFLAEDEKDLRELTRDLLEPEGFIVLEARSGDEALARMRGISGPAVAIIDLVMPRMDGWKLIETIRSDAKLKRIPIIVVSGQPRLTVQGADLVLRKPVAPSDLLRHVIDLCA